MVGWKGSGAPFLQRAGGHHVSVAGEAQHGTALAMRGPEVLDVAEVQLFDAEPRCRQSRGHQVLAAAVHRCNRSARNQFLGQLERVGVVHVTRNSINPHAALWQAIGALQ